MTQVDHLLGYLLLSVTGEVTFRQLTSSHTVGQL